MRKWLYFLLIIAVAYVISQMGKKTKGRSSFLKNISETIGIIVWVLIVVYTVGFLYWLYTELFK
jgi:cytochrome b561